MQWFIDRIIQMSEELNLAAENIQNLVDTLNSQEYVDSSLIISFIANIHYIAGNIIFYECIAIIGIGIVVTIVKLIIAILNIIRMVKQTVLF